MFNKYPSGLFLLVVLVISCCIMPAKVLDRSEKHQEQDMYDTFTLASAVFCTTAKDQLNSISFQKLGKYVPIEGNLEQMNYFFNALKNSRNQRIRIAHFGDSLIMGDIITEYFRNKFQSTYGGRGVGLVSINADDSRMRRTVNHTYSNDWTYASIVSGDRQQYPLGMNGTVCVPKPGSWVKYGATRLFENASSFDIVKLIYNNADKSSVIEYSFDNDTPQHVNLENGSAFQQLVLDPKRNVTKVTIKFISGKEPFMYGVSLETSGKGVYVDNLSLRGNSGVSLLDVSSNTYESYEKFFDYNLVILNFGANVSFADRNAYIVYEKKMEEVVEKLKKAFPQTSFLLVGVGDKTMKRGSRYMTNPDIPFLREIQKKIATKTGIAYWDLWEAMGGNNSMFDWVNAAPPLAYRDYLHFNSEGGEVIADLLYEAIIKANHN